MYSCNSELCMIYSFKPPASKKANYGKLTLGMKYDDIEANIEELGEFKFEFNEGGGG